MCDTVRTMPEKFKRNRLPCNVTVAKAVFEFVERNRGKESRSQFVENLMRAGIRVWNEKKGVKRDSRRLL